MQYSFKRHAAVSPACRWSATGVPVWPDRLFADGAHLDAAGARLFSEPPGRLRPMAAFSPAATFSGTRRPTASRTGSAVLEVQQQGDRQH